MDFVLGFDPGGKNAFGWCVAEFGTSLPLRIVNTGVVDDAEAAVNAALKDIKRSDHVLAIGVDAPMFWTPTGSRVVDSMVRNDVKRSGGHGSTVMAINSLQGSCLVQGILVGLLVRQSQPALRISECHPKALLWNIGLNPNVSGHWPPPLHQFLSASQCPGTGHERDASIAVLSGWAMHTRPPRWRDLFPHETHPLSPLSQPIGYWMPV